MARVRRYMNRIHGWELTGTAVNANADEVPQLVPALPRLQELTVQARNLWSQQAALNASKQEINRMLRQVLRDGDAVTDFIRTGARAHYGAGSEKLVEFGVQPFRGRNAKSEPEAPTPEAPAPATLTSDTVK